MGTLLKFIAYGGWVIGFIVAGGNGLLIGFLIGLVLIFTGLVKESSGFEPPNDSQDRWK